MRTQTDSNSKEPRLSGSSAPIALSKMLAAMEELDAPENMPEGLNQAIWERFCFVRRTKVESEQKVICDHREVTVCLPISILLIALINSPI